MNYKLENWLIEEYPSLFEMTDNEIKEIYNQEKFPCRGGWFLIINTVFELLVKRSSEVKIIQVEETYGFLLVTFSNYKNKDYDYIFGICNMAHNLSQITCEICGQQGSMFNGRYLTARCKLHNGLSIRNQEDGVLDKLPFRVDNLGDRWYQMVVTLYEKILMHQKCNEMPEVIITQVEKTNGKLCIGYYGGDESTQGMIEFLLAYSMKINDDTGQVISRTEYENLLSI